MNQTDSPLVFPLSEDESLKDLQDHLKIDLAKHFKEARLRQSENCYISFQIYEFPEEVVKYLNVESYQFYEKSFRQLVTLIKQEVGNNRNADISRIDIKSFIRNLVERIVFYIHDINEICENWNPSLEQQFNARKEKFSADKIGPVIDKACEDFCEKLSAIRNDIDAISSKSQQVTWKRWRSRGLVNILRRVLQSILQGLEQSLSVGLAEEVYSKSSGSKEIVRYEDITKIQRKKISLSTDSENAWNYLFITNIERFFFPGGFGGKRSSFILFAPLYMYGQRLGYMFIIESYSSEEERRKKIEEATKFLEAHKEHEAVFLKELKEKRLYEKIAGELRRSNDYSDAYFFEILKQHIPAIINFTEKVEWKGPERCANNQVRRITVIPGRAKSVVQIPLRIRENGGGSYTPLGVLEGEVHEFEGNALSQDENRQGLERAISTATDLFLLNRQIQKVAKDAEWKTIVDEMSHSMAFPFGEVNRRLHETSVYIDRGNLSAASSQLQQARAVVDQLSGINKFLFYLVKASESSPENWDYPMREALEIKDVSLTTLFDDCLNNIGYSLPLLQLSTFNHKEKIQSSIDQFRADTLKAIERLRIRVVPDGLRIVLLDLLKNALKETDEQNPNIEVSFVKNFNEAFHALCFKNNKSMTKEAYNFLVHGNETESMSKSRKVGWRTIKRILGFKWLVESATLCDYYVDPSSIEPQLGETKIFLLIPKEAVHENANEEN